MVASAMAFLGRTVTYFAGRPKLARETATLASPPPKVAMSSGDLEEAFCVGRGEAQHDFAEGDGGFGDHGFGLRREYTTW